MLPQSFYYSEASCKFALSFLVVQVNARQHRLDMNRRSLATPVATQFECSDTKQLIRQGLSFLDDGFFDKAVCKFDQALACLQDSAVVWYHHGDALANLGQYKRALRSFEQALGLDENYCEAWTFRGVMLVYLGHYQAALESCDRALTLQPANKEAWIFRGIALQRLGQYRQAYSSYSHALAD
jgi:tetratricopeptide (TPR) repeat protein